MSRQGLFITHTTQGSSLGLSEVLFSAEPEPLDIGVGGGLQHRFPAHPLHVGTAGPHAGPTLSLVLMVALSVVLALIPCHGRGR